MLINAERQPADQDAGDLCDPTQYAPRDRRPYWNEDIAAFSAAVWLPDRNHRLPCGYQHITRLVQQNRSPFMVLCEPHRGPQPRPAQALLVSRGAGHDRAHHRWRHQATGSPDSGLSRQHPEDGYRHLADRQPLDLQPHRRDPAVRHSGRMETHRQHGNAGSQSAPSRMGFGPLPGEAHGSQRRLPGHEQRQDLQPGTQGSQTHGNRADEDSPNSATAAARTPSSPATYQTTP